uniref:Putative secreted peptide n=1 Tax=Anopheles braziliensis TaxID=58242 RepID=A0A2M3ZN26_9DIPT
MEIFKALLRFFSLTFSSYVLLFASYLRCAFILTLCTPPARSPVLHCVCSKETTTPQDKVWSSGSLLLVREK